MLGARTHRSTRNPRLKMTMRFLELRANRRYSAMGTRDAYSATKRHDGAKSSSLGTPPMGAGIRASGGGSVWCWSSPGT